MFAVQALTVNEAVIFANFIAIGGEAITLFSFFARTFIASLKSRTNDSNSREYPLVKVRGSLVRIDRLGALLNAAFRYQCIPWHDDPLSALNRCVATTESRSNKHFIKSPLAIADGSASHLESPLIDVTPRAQVESRRVHAGSASSISIMGTIALLFSGRYVARDCIALRGPVLALLAEHSLRFPWHGP